MDDMDEITETYAPSGIRSTFLIGIFHATTVPDSILQAETPTSSTKDNTTTIAIQILSEHKTAVTHLRKYFLLRTS